MLNPTFCPYPLRPPTVAADAVRRWNTVSYKASQDTVVASAIPRPKRWKGRFFVVRYPAGDRERAIKAAVFSRQVGHCQRFPAHYDWSCPPVSLLPPSSSYRIYDSVLIFCLPFRPASLLLSSSSHLSATSLLLLSQYFRVSANPTTLRYVMICLRYPPSSPIYPSTFPPPERLVRSFDRARSSGASSLLGILAAAWTAQA